MTEPPTLETRFREFFLIVGSCVLLSVVYGVLHDLVTAHVQFEYFLPPWHPKIISSESPVALALLWGVVATWWMGAFFGGIIGAASVFGRYPPVAWTWVVKRVAILLAVSLVLAYVLLFSMIGAFVGLGPNDPKQQRLGFILITHNFSYFFTAFVALGFTASIIRKRKFPEPPVSEG